MANKAKAAGIAQRQPVKIEELEAKLEETP
jgi:hypothetical protein